MKSISLKPALLSASVDFLGEENMGCLVTQDGLPELISQLLYYKEEGKSLFPEIFIFDDFKTVKGILPNLQHCIIGEGKKEKETLLKALKKCAPLTENGWVIYILRKEEVFEYGVIRAGTSILSVSISDALIDQEMDGFNAILIHQVAEKLIEVKGTNADSLMISYGNHIQDGESPINNQFKFIESIVECVDEDLKEPTIIFFKKLFIKVLQEGHGTLACVIKSKKTIVPVKLKDGIHLKKRINIPKIIDDLLKNDDLQANSKLEGQQSLIIGMLQSDGITVFTNSGEICSYNVFVKHYKRSENVGTSGGARSRTFITLTKMIGKGIEAAYIQSQDGKIGYENGR